MICNLGWLAVIYLATGAALFVAWALALWACEDEWPPVTDLVLFVLAWPMIVWRALCESEA